MSQATNKVKFVGPTHRIVLRPKKTDIGCCKLRQVEGGMYLICNFSIRKRYRGKGHGKELMKLVLDRFPENITLFVKPDNAPAIAVYRHHGFVNVGQAVVKSRGKIEQAEIMLRWHG